MLWVVRAGHSSMTFNPLDLIERYALGFVSYLATFFDRRTGADDVLTLERDGRLATYSFLGALLAVSVSYVLLNQAFPKASMFWFLVAALIGSWVLLITILHVAARCSGGQIRIIDSTAAGLRVFPIAAALAALVGAGAYHSMYWFSNTADDSMMLSYVFASLTYAVLIILYLPCAIASVSKLNRFSRVVSGGVVASTAFSLGVVISLSLGVLGD